ncbi:GNAT family N-acetyltransferase [Rhodanobacter sp. 7MK24]|nr:GNAT family N-acetyltransferase [Rhodanobacter sp. 7MK24]
MPLPNPPGPAELAIPPLALRPWRDDDAQALHEAIRESLDSVGRWLQWCHVNYDLDAARQRIAACKQGWDAGGQYAFAVFDATGRLAGGVGLNQLDERNMRGNLGYWMRTSVNGRGYAAHAARAVAVFGFETLGLQRIEIVAATGNLASQRCAERIGARREGIARSRVLMHGQSEDAVVYGLVPTDLDQPAAAQNAATSS